MRFRPLEPGIEVNGQTVWALVDGFSLLKKIPSRALLEAGIGVAGEGGLVEVRKDGWYPQAAWLRAFEAIVREVGEGALFSIGLRIPDNAAFPAWVVDVESALRAVDVAYHMNHRRRGVVMYDAASGHMLEGIGHYAHRRDGPRSFIVECTTPYPCDFDKGILTTMARRFERSAVVRHDDASPCRKAGRDACMYRVAW